MVFIKEDDDMNMELIINIIEVVLYVILGGLAIWFRSNDKLKGKVAELINIAESMFTDTTKAGGKRFEWVVNSLYELLPKAVRKVFPKSIIESIVQNVFDSMKDFAKKNLDTLTDKVIDDNNNETV